ncbi:MAG: hypothetical protein IKG91_06605 [Firmicutes bacterium]|nr:hypothetical protein [Bacillota bacterium]
MATKKKTEAEPKTLSEQEMNKISVDTSKKIAEQKKYMVILPEVPSGDKTLRFCVNGVHYAVPRGVQVEVPETIYHIIENMRTQDRMQKAVVDRLKKWSGRSM